ncbi:hypothetical protein Hanom_Chr14g01253501 [Helianthus anomalus]
MRFLQFNDAIAAAIEASHIKLGFKGSKTKSTFHQNMCLFVSSETERVGGNHDIIAISLITISLNIKSHVCCCVS